MCNIIVLVTCTKRTTDAVDVGTTSVRNFCSVFPLLADVDPGWYSRYDPAIRNIYFFFCSPITILYCTPFVLIHFLIIVEFFFCTSWKKFRTFFFSLPLMQNGPVDNYQNQIALANMIS